LMFADGPIGGRGRRGWADGGFQDPKNDRSEGCEQASRDLSGPCLQHFVDSGPGMGGRKAASRLAWLEAHEALPALP
jgi:hypothetical protein